MSKTVCVIGGGLAGGIVGSTLAKRGHQVTLLELGDSPAPLVPDNEILHDSGALPPLFTRGSGVGGTSNFWHGGLTVLDSTDVEGTSEQDRCHALQISYGELREYYRQAVSLVREGAEFSLDDIEAAPTPPLGIHADGAFKLKALLYPDRPFSTRTLIERAQTFHGLQLVRNFEVRRLGSAGGATVRYADGIDLRTGLERRIHADIFVLCAGGLGSPKVLLQSGVDLPQLRQLPVGRHLIDHPTGFLFKAKLRERMNLRPLFGLARRGFKLRYGFALRPNSLAEVQDRNHIVYLRPSISMKDPRAYERLKRNLVGYRANGLRLSDVVGLVRHADLMLDAIGFKYGVTVSTTHVSGLIFAEQHPDDDSRVSLLGNGRFSVRWRVSERDRASLERFLGLFFETYANLFETVKIFPDLSARLASAAHHSGACRMAASARGGVVDGNYRVFGIDNLFVIDGSVLARSGHANTGLTIAALALRACDTIAHH